MQTRVSRIFRLGTASALLLAVLPVLAPSNAGADEPDPIAPAERFNGRRAYDYLKQICALGARISGSEAMAQQQLLLQKHFTELGGQVEFQRFEFKRHPLTGQPVEMANLIVRWHPEAAERLLLCTHYDTRPYADREANPRLRKLGLFLGANDGGSGTALLMELGHHVKNLPDRYGLDFVCFDAEEFVFSKRDEYFLGSTHFAEDYVEHPPAHRYVGGVLLDMVGDAKLSIYQEAHSAMWPQSRQLVQEIWGTAARLGVKEFIPRIGYQVDDDHLPLNRIAQIPVCDVIDFHYPDRLNRYWHTTADTPARCSAESLGKVGWVIQEWLATMQ
jgi:hypothetical protein